MSLDKIIDKLNDAIARSRDDARNDIFIMNKMTLKGGCRRACESFLSYAAEMGLGLQDGKLIRLEFRMDPNDAWSGGWHFVAGFKYDNNSYIADPTITQFFDDATKYIFRAEEYPVNIVDAWEVKSRLYNSK